MSFFLISWAAVRQAFDGRIRNYLSQFNRNLWALCRFVDKLLGFCRIHSIHCHLLPLSARPVPVSTRKASQGHPGHASTSQIEELASGYPRKILFFNLHTLYLLLFSKSTLFSILNSLDFSLPSGYYCEIS